MTVAKLKYQQHSNTARPTTLLQPSQTEDTEPKEAESALRKQMSIAERDAALMNAWKEREGSLANAEFEDGKVEEGYRRHVVRAHSSWGRLESDLCPIESQRLSLYMKFNRRFPPSDIPVLREFDVLAFERRHVRLFPFAQWGQRRPLRRYGQATPKPTKTRGPRHDVISYHHAKIARSWAQYAVCVQSSGCEDTKDVACRFFSAAEVVQSRVAYVVGDLDRLGRREWAPGRPGAWVETIIEEGLLLIDAPSADTAAAP
ncbi:hypothetical protein EIP86_011032 [Pleurotus ostreatoroseus]|nr:hypothetical protein EIP86_011032 [Pleurotus ostreatoroseus]